MFCRGNAWLTTNMSQRRFPVVVGGIAVLAAAAGTAVPFVAGSTGAFRGAIVGSDLVALVFAAENAYSVFGGGPTRFASGVVAGVLGLRLVAAPLTYDAGATATAGAQTTGMLLATTAGYAALDAIERGFADGRTTDASTGAGQEG